MSVSLVRGASASSSRSAVQSDRYLQLFEALSPLIGSHCPEEIASVAVRVMADLLEVEACSIFLFNPEKEALRLAAATHIPKKQWKGVEVSAKTGLCGRVFSTGQALLLKRAEDFAEFGISPTRAYGRPSCVVVPIVVRGQTEGVVNVANPRRPRPFNGRDLKLIEAAARLVAGGIQNALQFNETVLIHDHLEQIFDNLHVGVIALDARLRITHSNGRMRELLGKAKQKIRNRELKSVLPAPVFNVCRRLIRDSYGPSAVQQDRLAAELGGRERQLEVTCSRISCTGQARSDCLLMFEEVGQDEEVRRLREADSIKSAFLRLISHELRTPLTVIGGAMPILRTCTEGVNGQQGPMLARVETILRTNVQKMSGLVNTLLDVVEIENGSMKLSIGPVDLAELIRERLAMVAERARAKAIVWDIALEDGIPPVAADRARLGQALYELLDNATKFAPDDSPVRVEARRDGGRAEVKILNVGAPIPKRRRSDVFERFYQVDGSTTRKSGGFGLGLYLVKNVLGLHGGTIEIVDGPSPEWTVFKVTLPLAETPPSAGIAVPPAPAEPAEPPR